MDANRNPQQHIRNIDSWVYFAAARRIIHLTKATGTNKIHASFQLHLRPFSIFLQTVIFNKFQVQTNVWHDWSVAEIPRMVKGGKDIKGPH